MLGTVRDRRAPATRELVLPITTMAEENGTYVNRDGRVQRFLQAKGAPGMARPAGGSPGEVLARPGPGQRCAGDRAPRRSRAGRSTDPAFAGLTLRRPRLHRARCSRAGRAPARERAR